MKTINFNEGYKEYQIGDDSSRIIRLRVTDLNFGKRLNDMEKKLADFDEKYKALTVSYDADLYYEADREFRKMVEEAFGTDVCTPAFGDANCMTPVDSAGTPIFKAFFEAFMPIVAEDIKEYMPKQQLSPKAESYLKPVSAPTIKPVRPIAKPVAGLAQPYAATGDLDVSKLSKEDKALLIAQLLA